MPDKRALGKRKLRLAPTQIIALAFVGVILLGALILSLPISSRDGTSPGFLPALFTATSATCVTGLVMFDTWTQWNGFGQTVILCLIEIGGLGFMSAASLVIFLFRRRVGLKQRMVMAQALSVSDMTSVVRLQKIMIFGSLLVQLVGAIILTIHFWPVYGLGRAARWGVFHAVSAFCNAGFDIFGVLKAGSSLMLFQSDPVVLLTLGSLVAVGGLGFFVWEEVIRVRNWKKFSVYTKLVLLMTAILLLGGMLGFCLLEWNNPETLGDLPWYDKLLGGLFQSMTVRTAGFDALGQGGLTEGGKAFSMILMFIGGAIGYYASEMLMKKSFKVFRGSFKQLVICFAIIALGMLALELDLFGVERRIPNAEQVSSVRLSDGGTNCNLEEPENIKAAMQLHESIINNKALYERDTNSNVRCTTVRVIYILENGKKISRSYRIANGEYYDGDKWVYGEAPADLYTLQEIGNCREAVLDRKKTTIPVTPETIVYGSVVAYNPNTNTEYHFELTNEEAWELYHECVVPDIEEQKLGRIWVITDDSYYNTVCDASINIDLYSREGVAVEDGYYITHDDSFSTTVTVDAVRTVNWLKEHGIEVFSVAQRPDGAEKYYYAEAGGPIAVTEDVEIKYETVAPDKRGDIQ